MEYFKCYYMSYLFGKCENIEYLPDISNWNTSNVKYMQGIFTNFLLL